MNRQPTIEAAPAANAASWSIWIILALVVLPVLAFIPVFGAEFLTWDDYENVAKNPAIANASMDSIASWWTNIDKPFGELYIPLTYTAWSMLAPMAQLEAPRPDGILLSPGVFHAANVLVHIGSTFLVYLILRQMISRSWPAAIGALLFALHPVQVESVAWVTGMKDVLSGFFLFAAIYAFLRFAQNASGSLSRYPGGGLERGHLMRGSKEKDPHPNLPRSSGRGEEARAAGQGSKKKWLWYLTALVLFIFSTVAKPSSVIGPVLVAIIVIAASASRSHEGTTSPKRPPAFKILAQMLPWLAPWLLVSLLIIIETRHVQPASRIEHVALWMRPLVAGDALAFYFRHLLLPMNLAPDYGRTPSAVSQDATMYWIWIVPVGLLIVGSLLRKRAPWLLVGMALFFLAPLPVLGLFPFSFQLYSTVADHYMYVAMIGPALVLAAIANHFWNRATATAAAALLIVLGVASYAQATRWHDTTGLFTYTLKINPRSFVSHGQLAYLAAADARNEEAAEHYAAAVRIRPNDFFSNYNWGNLLLHEGNYSAALERYQCAVRAMPDSAPAHNNCGVALINLHRPMEAADEFEKATRADPNYADAEKNLGLVMLMTRNYPAAYEHFQRTLAIDPSNQIARKKIELLDSQRSGAKSSP